MVKWETRKPTRWRVQNDSSKSNFGVVWCWPLTTWSRKLTISSLARGPFVPICSKNGSSIFAAKSVNKCSRYHAHKFGLCWPSVTSRFDLLTPKVGRFISSPIDHLCQCAWTVVHLFSNLVVRKSRNVRTTGQVKNVMPPGSRNWHRHKIPIWIILVY